MSPELERLLAEHLPPPRVGKVRNLYDLPIQYMGRPLLLSVKTNRLSMFDFQMGFANPGQAQMLNAFDIAAKLHLHRVAPDIETDLVAYGQTIDKFLRHALHDNAELQRIATAVEEFDMSPALEHVGRTHATGTFYKAYKEARGKPVWGHKFPPDLSEGFKFDKPIYTPTTKAPAGHHDEPLDYLEVREEYGTEFEEITLRILDIFTKLAAQGGLILVDFKDEMGRRISELPNGKYRVGDELITPHSSRLWLHADYDKCYPNSVPDSFDKQIGREWGKRMGIDKLDPKNEADRQVVLAMEIPPPMVMDRMRQRGLEAFELMYKMPLTQFQRQIMKIAD